MGQGVYFLNTERRPAIYSCSCDTAWKAVGSRPSGSISGSSWEAAALHLCRLMMLLLLLLAMLIAG